MPRVIGVDSSTQSCKVLVVDVASGEILSEATTPHPEGSEIDPEYWWSALRNSLDQVDTSGVEAISIGAQQHGLVALDARGVVLRPALLWNDTRSAPQAERLIAEFGAANLAERTGSVPVASFTSTKLAWVREHEPHLARTNCCGSASPRLADMAASGLRSSRKLRSWPPTGRARDRSLGC